MRELTPYAAVITQETPDDAARMSGSAYDWLITTSYMSADDVHGTDFDAVLSDEENLIATDQYPSLASSGVRQYVHTQGLNNDAVRTFAVVGWASTYDVVQLRGIGVHADHWLVHVHAQRLGDLQRVHRVLGELVPGADRRNPKSVSIHITFGVDTDLSEVKLAKRTNPSPGTWYDNLSALLMRDPRKYVCRVVEKYGPHTKLCISFGLGLMTPDTLEIFQTRFVFPGSLKSAVDIGDSVVWCDTSVSGIGLIRESDHAGVSDQEAAELQVQMPGRREKIQMAARNLMVSRRASCTDTFRASIRSGGIAGANMGEVVDLLAAQVPADRFCNVAGFFAAACGDEQEQEQEKEHNSNTHEEPQTMGGGAGLPGDIMLSTDKFPWLLWRVRQSKAHASAPRRTSRLVCLLEVCQ